MGTFEDIVLARLQAKDTFGLNWYLRNAASVFFAALDEITAKEVISNADISSEVVDNRLLPILDNLAVLAITSAQYEEVKLVVGVRDTLYEIYSRANSYDFSGIAWSAETGRINGVWIWGEIIKRVYTIGAAHIRMKLYGNVPTLVRQPIAWDRDYWYKRFWSRHALTELARASRLASKGLVAITQPMIEEREWFYRIFGSNRDNVLDALCQFDLIQCIHTIDSTGLVKDGYPSFGGYYNSRTEPIVSLLVENGEIRAELIPSMPDERLATILRRLDDVAAREFVMFNGWDSEQWRDGVVKTFLATQRIDESIR